MSSTAGFRKPFSRLLALSLHSYTQYSASIFRPFSSSVTGSTIASKLLKKQQDNPSASEGWAWVPPRTMEHLETEALKKRYKLPVRTGCLIEADELKAFLEDNGGENVIVIKLDRPLVDISRFVIASFPSTRLIRKAAEAIKENLRQRELFHVLGSKDIEGNKDEEWQAVDCQQILVHLMLPDIRRHIDLENHWGSSSKPVINLSGSEDEFDRKMEELLDQYPVPGDYKVEKSQSKFHGFDQEVKSL